MEILYLLPFVIAAIFTVFATYLMRERLKNLEAAWEYRKRIAQTAATIEHDESAPLDVRHTISILANHAFDEELFKQLAQYPSEMPLSVTKGLKAQMQKRYGDQYGEALYNATRDLSYVALLSDIKWGKRIRNVKSRNEKARTIKSERTSMMQNILRWFDSNRAEQEHHIPAHVH